MSLRRILILDENYPSESNHYADVFVHVRAKAYARHAEVVVASTPNPSPGWTHEGIPVRTFPTAADLSSFVDHFRPDVIAGHFVEGPVITDVLLRTRIPLVVWVHGYEALGWYRRLYNLQSLRGAMVRAYTNTRQLLRFRRLIGHLNRVGSGAFVFPSRWMQRVTEIDTLSRIRHAEIVPNPIDGALFRYVPKVLEMRTRVLLVRSFDSRKYATDVAADAIVRLAAHPAFESFRFRIYGSGGLFSEFAARVQRYPNVTLHEGFVPQRDLPAIHAEHGVFLCPSRQDAQGVSMCESMASGLVPVTSRNTAIPEFVEDGKTGFLTRSSAEIARRLLELHNDPAHFQRVSENAARSIRAKCELQGVVERELTILARAASPGRSTVTESGA